MKEYNQKLLGVVDRWISIEIQGETFEVPDRVELLRAFQHLEFEIDYSKLCWNGSCQRCIVSTNQNPSDVMACRFRTCENLEVSRVPSAIRIQPKK